MLLNTLLESSPRVVAIISVSRKVINAGLEVICEINSEITLEVKRSSKPLNSVKRPLHNLHYLYVEVEK